MWFAGWALNPRRDDDDEQRGPHSRTTALQCAVAMHTYFFPIAPPAGGVYDSSPGFRSRSRYTMPVVVLHLACPFAVARFGFELELGFDWTMGDRYTCAHTDYRPSYTSRTQEAEWRWRAAGELVDTATARARHDQTQTNVKQAWAKYWIPG